MKVKSNYALVEIDKVEVKVISDCLVFLDNLNDEILSVNLADYKINGRDDYRDITKDEMRITRETLRKLIKFSPHLEVRFLEIDK